ncbi:MAG: class I SAM-dependent methyltransferase [Acidimicrobiales bacterium]|nr:class I SAM-dependent methyltransferase [Acidimicrobiales bacterium]
MTTCPACAATELRFIDSQSGIPGNSCLLLDSATAAAAFPTGDMTLTVCQGCGFVFNATFDPTLSEYSARYEETQGCSPRFVEFARALASRWVEDYDLVDRTVLEIGCGSMGEFLQLMVEAGVGRAVGVDPALEPRRIDVAEPDRFEWIPDFYPVPDITDDVSAIVCRHTLEHIASVGDFMRSLRQTIGARTDVIVLFELPDVQRVFDEVAFWDVYYEHCSYFTAGSLARLFRASGFDPIKITHEYDDQYVVIEARPSPDGPPSHSPSGGAELLELIASAEEYGRRVTTVRRQWRDRVSAAVDEGQRVVIWGAGSKGVSFLTGLRENDIQFAVDINPAKHGFFMAGTGQEIVAPDFLATYQPDLVVAMNPIYLDEIQQELEERGLSAELIGV